MSAINFHFESIKNCVHHQPKLKKWLIKLGKSHNRKIDELNYIFCNDEYLYEMNMNYLNHKTYTDIITFDNTEPSDKNIIGDIFISIDRVKENAQKFNVSGGEELARVMAHGLLHLIGYKDKSTVDSNAMRIAENNAIELLKGLNA